jgi:ATP-dependent DNA helicase HFM1/MER3
MLHTSLFCCLQAAVAGCRFVAVSATVPNMPDLAAWLRVPPEGLRVYGEEMRPVRLRTVVRGYTASKVRQAQPVA